MNLCFSITAEMNSERSDGTAKACCWSVTINNPTDEDKLQWSNLTALPWVREVSGQLESGEGGTLHIQGMVKTASVRFSQVKKALPRAHIEAARSPAALAKYVVKKDTRVASIQTVRTASQSDVQRHCYRHVVQQCYLLYQRKHNLTLLDPTTINEGELLLEFSDVIRRHWETYVDEAVRDLIKDGYFGVEYVMANPQVRTAFKKYLPEICYRFYEYANPSQSSPSPEAQNQPPQEGTLAKTNHPEGGSLDEA